MRATIRAPRVKKMRLRSSLALEMEPKLKLAASCSAADAIRCSRRTRRSYMGMPPCPCEVRGPVPLSLARFPLFGRFRAARLALARLTLLVAVNFLLVGGGHRTARLFDRFLGGSAHASHFDLDLGGDGALAQQTHAVAALMRQTGLAQ